MSLILALIEVVIYLYYYLPIKKNSIIFFFLNHKCLLLHSDICGHVTIKDLG